MRFTFISLFSNLIKPYFSDSILKKAMDKKLFCIDFANPRDYAKNKHKKVDEYMISGGAGLLMSCKPLCACLEDVLKSSPNAHVIFLSPSGKSFKQKDARRLAKKKHLVLVSGRYEGVDERVCELFANEVLSTGDFVLTGGELPSLCLADAVARNIPGVLGNAASLEVESFEEDMLEGPNFTKPINFRNSLVPSEFLKGNHAKIFALKYKLAISKTKFHRPDLFSAKKEL